MLGWRRIPIPVAGPHCDALCGPQDARSVTSLGSQRLLVRSGDTSRPDLHRASSPPQHKRDLAQGAKWKKFTSHIVGGNVAADCPPTNPPWMRDALDGPQRQVRFHVPTLHAGMLTNGACFRLKPALHHTANPNTNREPRSEKCEPRLNVYKSDSSVSPRLRGP